MSSSQPPSASAKHQYTSLSSLIQSPDPPSSPQQDATGGVKPQRSGWHLPSVEEERVNRSRSRSKNRVRADGAGSKEKEKGRRLSTWQMMALTVSMGGSQVGTVSSANYMY